MEKNLEIEYKMLLSEARDFDSYRASDLKKR